jgi:hypothetical protein
MTKSDEAKAREHRLAAKLRENLRRRKRPAEPHGTGEGKGPQERAASPAKDGGEA